MYRYRNANTGDIHESDEPRPDLEARDNWSLITGDETADAAPAQVTADAVVAALPEFTREDRNRVRMELAKFEDADGVTPEVAAAIREDALGLVHPEFGDAGEPMPATPDTAPADTGQAPTAEAAPANAEPAQARAAVPKRNAALPEWREYAMNVCGATPEQIHGMTRDQLRDEYGPDAD